MPDILTAEFIIQILEDNIVAGGFILLLYYVLHKQDLQLQKFVQQMERSNEALDKISTTLTVFDSRLQRVENDSKKE